MKPDNLITPYEYAKKSGYSRQNISLLIKKGVIPTVTIQINQEYIDINVFPIVQNPKKK